MVQPPNNSVKKGPSLQQSTFLEWIPVALIMITAASLKIRWDLPSTYFTSGGDGPYYPLQVRSIIEHFRLAFPDMPLLFTLDAGIAKLFELIGSSTPNNSILLAIVCLDILLPPLAAIPVFIIAKELKPAGAKSSFVNYLMVCFATLNFSTLVLFPNSLLNKNALAVIWVFFYIYFVLRFVKYRKKKDFYLSLLLLIICALTHFGSFSILLLFTLLTFSIWIMGHLEVLKSTSRKKILLVAGGAILLLSFLALLDLERFKRLIEIPLKVFEAPLLLFWMNDEGSMLSPLVIANLVPVNLLAIIGLILLLKNRKRMDEASRILGFTMVILAFCLSSPLIGLEWASRFFMMSYIPLTVLYLILFNIIQSKWWIAIPAVLFLGLVASYIAMGATLPPGSDITDEAFIDFKRINGQIHLGRHSVLLGRQDLRLLASWFFRTKSTADYLLTKDDFNTNDSIYVIRQIKGSNMPSVRFRETQVPTGALKVFGDEYFELYQLKNSDGWNFGNGRPSTARGVISEVNKNWITVTNPVTGVVRTILLSKKTAIHLIDQELSKGTYVEIWGERMPFSLKIDAEKIEEASQQ